MNPCTVTYRVFGMLLLPTLVESYKIWSSWPKDDQKPITCCFLGSHIPKNSIESNTWICLEFQNPQKFPKTDRWFERFKKIGGKTNGFLSPKCWRPCRSFALDEPHSWKGSASDARMETKSNPLGDRKNHREAEKGILQNFWPIQVWP